MDERGANIDILFRNGLKDYEALPPAETWDNIYPVIKRKQRPVLIFRAAATFAVLLSLGLLTYRWSTEFNPGLESETFVVNDLQDLPAEVSEPVLAASFKEAAVVLYDPVKEVIADQSDKSVTPGSIKLAYAGEFTEGPEQASLIPNEKSSSGISSVIREDYPLNDSPTLLYDETMAETSTLLSNRWSVAALVSPAYYNRMSSGNNEAVSKVIAAEKPVISYTGGVSLAYKVSRRFTVQSGVYYSSIGQNIPGISSYSGFSEHDYTKGDRNFDVLTVNGTIYTRNGDVFLTDRIEADRVLTRYTSDVIDPVKAELDYVNDYLRQNFSYLEFPVLVRYKLIDKTFDLNLVGGVSSNFLVGNSVYTPVNGGKFEIGETDGLNPVTFSSSVGMGMEYNLSGNLSLNLEPTFRYYINPFSSMPGMKIHPYSFGVFSGITYKF
jgi:hypothetical protein